MSGAELITTERARQVHKEGYTAAMDSGYTKCQLLDAALCYAGVAGSQVLDQDGGEEAKLESLIEWPWGEDTWKPSDDPVRNLVKAGALIAAEIDRLQERAARETQAGV